MATHLQILRKYAPFINQTILELYRGLGFHLKLRSGNAFKITTKSVKEDDFGDAFIFPGSYIPRILTDPSLKKLGFWTSLGGLDFLRKNTEEHNFAEKVEELFIKKRIRRETYEFAKKGRKHVLETLSKLRRLARLRDIPYIPATREPLSSFVHEKLHEVCGKLGNFKDYYYSSKRKDCKSLMDLDDYIECVENLVLEVLIEKTEGDFKKYLKEDLKSNYDCKRYTEHPFSTKILELAEKHLLSRTEINELLISLNEKDLTKTVKKIIKKHKNH